MGHHLHHPSHIASKACGDRDVRMRRLFICSVVCPWVCVNLYASLFFSLHSFLWDLLISLQTYNVFTLWFLGHCVSHFILQMPPYYSILSTAQEDSLVSMVWPLECTMAGITIYAVDIAFVFGIAFFPYIPHRYLSCYDTRVSIDSFPQSYI
jgi:hypothetical protein